MQHEESLRLIEQAIHGVNKLLKELGEGDSSLILNKLNHLEAARRLALQGRSYDEVMKKIHLAFGMDDIPSSNFNIAEVN